MHPREGQAGQQLGKHEMGEPTAMSGGRELCFFGHPATVTKVDVLFKLSFGYVWEYNQGN